MPRDPLLDEQLTGSVIGAFFEVYNTLGFGLLEQLYSAALERELRIRGHRVDREFQVVVTYKGTVLGKQRLDLVVDERLVVEVKSTARLSRVATRQLYSYLHATGLHVGLLMHFGPEPKFYRVVHLDDARGGAP
jgi:GxxExxY protein